MNWQLEALEQTPEEDPWIAFQDTPSRAAPGGAAPAAEAAAEGPRAPEDIFVTLGCAGCHNLDQPQTDANRGPVGPHLGNLAENAATRVTGQDASEYVHTSILHPNDYIVPGYPANIMPQNLADRITQEELDMLVEWLLSPDR
jgi:cytochrome c551/c552